MAEHDEQAAVIAWARMMGGRWQCLDWLHAIPTGNENGIREKQRAFMEYAEGVGYLCQVHDNAEDAIEALEWYLNGEIWLAPSLPAAIAGNGAG